MLKEKLSLVNIKIDLLARLKYYYSNLLAYILCFLTLLAFFIWVNCSSADVIYKVLFAVFPLLVLPTTVSQIVDIIRLHGVLRRPLTVVKDKLTYKEERRFLKNYHGRNEGYFRLHFSGFGAYLPLAVEHYSWSSLFPKEAKTVYEDADQGDEYYLVLSKPHTGEILFIYNTKLFEIQSQAVKT